VFLLTHKNLNEFYLYLPLEIFIEKFIVLSMSKKNKPGMLLIGCAIVIELAAVIMIVKASATDSSSAMGISFLAIGLIFLVLGIKKVNPE
jgi:hypothetical protein